MSLLVQTDTTALKKRLELTEMASDTRSAHAQPMRGSTFLVSATQGIPDYDLSAALLSSIPLNAEMIFAVYSHWKALHPELIDHLTAILQSHRPALRERMGAAPTGKDIELIDALSDLRTSTEEAREDGLPVPSDKALKNGEHVLREMYRIWPRRFEVYPMREGEIAIDAPSGKGRSVMVLCDSQGGALCSVNLNGGHRRAHYSDARMLPDGFLRDAISDMRANGQE